MFGSLALIGFPIKTNPQTSKSMGLLICKDTWHCLRNIKSSTHRGGSLSGFKLEKKKKKNGGMSLTTHVEENRNGCNNNGQGCGHEKHRRVFRCGSSQASELPPRAPQAVRLLRSSELRLWPELSCRPSILCLCVSVCACVVCCFSTAHFVPHASLPPPPLLTASQ